MLCALFCWVLGSFFCCLGRQNRCINSALGTQRRTPLVDPGLLHLWSTLNDPRLVFNGARSFLRFAVFSHGVSSGWTLSVWFLSPSSESLQTLSHRAWGSAACTCRESGFVAHEAVHMHVHNFCKCVCMCF